jgi:hypothetical protein
MDILLQTIYCVKTKFLIFSIVSLFLLLSCELTFDSPGTKTVSINASDNFYTNAEISIYFETTKDSPDATGSNDESSDKTEFAVKVIEPGSSASISIVLNTSVKVIYNGYIYVVDDPGNSIDIGRENFGYDDDTAYCEIKTEE